MFSILERLNRRFQTIREEEFDSEWKNPNSSEYDRQWAEDALYHTVGPLTDNPTWVNSAWTSPSEPVPGFEPGRSAPRWSQEEVVFAYAGDPNMIFSASGNPRSPMYGNKGGAPLFRTARKIARIYNRSNDRPFIADLYSNGFVPLLRMMQPGFDESREPFITYVTRNIESAMGHGVGGTNQSNMVSGFETTERNVRPGLVGFKGLLTRSDPEEIRRLSQDVQGKYQETSSHEKHPDNPFGKYSAVYFRLANQYADALEGGDENQIEAARSQIQQQISTIDDENVFIPGASTGMGQAISTPDRKTSINIGSMDVASDNQEGGMAGNIMGDTDDESAIDPETINYIYDMAINHDLGDIIGGIPKYVAMAKKWGARNGKIGGKMTVNELRYSIRTMGPLGSNYPGRGMVRANLDVPRDSKGWWEPGSDPEIEPIPDDQKDPEDWAKWHSIWSREGYQAMGPTEISQEMTTEVLEFEKLGIATGRTIKTKTDNRTGKPRQEAVGKIAVANTLKAATIKIRFIALLERDSLGLDTGHRTTHRARAKEAEASQKKEGHRQNSIARQREIEKKAAEAEGGLPESKQKRHPLLEDIASTDNIDRQLIAEACDFVVARMTRVLTDKPQLLEFKLEEEFRMLPIDSIFLEEDPPPPPPPPSEGEEDPEADAEGGGEEAEKSPEELAAWDATATMAATVGNPAKGIP